MKKLLAILAICLMGPGGAWGATYYACIAGNISAANAWEDAAACDGTTYTITGAFPAAGDILEANNQAMVIDTNPGPNGNVILRNTAGGNFSATAAGTYTIDAGVVGVGVDCLLVGTGANAVTANICTTTGGCTITTGSVTGADGIYIAGSNTVTTIGKSGTPVTVTGGTGTNGAIQDNHSVTTTTIIGNITGGTGANARGLITGSTGTFAITGDIVGGTLATTPGIQAGSASTVTVTGNCTGTGSGAVTSGYGCSNVSTGTFTIIGDCIGSSVSSSAGCFGESTGTTSVTGNIVNTARATGINGNVLWNPSATSKYVKILGDGTPTYFYYTVNTDGTPDPAISNVRTGTTYGWDGSAVYTGTLAGGGAWAN